jgi:hypothetical protein
MAPRKSNSEKRPFAPYHEMTEKIEKITGIKRINMRELGEELGVTLAAVSDYKKKDFIPSNTMIKWCVKRKVSVDNLLGLKDYQPVTSSDTKTELKLIEIQEKMIKQLEEKLKKTSNSDETIKNLINLADQIQIMGNTGMGLCGDAKNSALYKSISRGMEKQSAEVDSMKARFFTEEEKKKAELKNYDIVDSLRSLKRSR